MSDNLLAQALRRIVDWNECDAQFRADFGSNGERDHYRAIALQSIAEHEGEKHAKPVAEVQDWPDDRTRRGIVPLVSWEDLPEGTKLYAAPPSESDKEDAELTDDEILHAVFGVGSVFVPVSARKDLLRRSRRVLRAARAKKEQS